MMPVLTSAFLRGRNIHSRVVGCRMSRLEVWKTSPVSESSVRVMVPAARTFKPDTKSRRTAEVLPRSSVRTWIFLRLVRRSKVKPSGVAIAMHSPSPGKVHEAAATTF